MSDAHRGFDWRSRSYREGALCETAAEVVAKAASAAAARLAPVFHFSLPPTNEIAFDVKDLMGVGEELTYPLVVTWELLVGGSNIVDGRRVLWRKTVLTSANARRTGRLFAYTGPVFKQAFLVGRLPVGALGVVTGSADITASLQQAVTGESVVIGSAIG